MSFLNNLFGYNKNKNRNKAIEELKKDAKINVDRYLRLKSKDNWRKATNKKYRKKNKETYKYKKIAIDNIDYLFMNFVTISELENKKVYKKDLLKIYNIILTSCLNTPIFEMELKEECKGGVNWDCECYDDKKYELGGPFCYSENYEKDKKIKFPCVNGKNIFK